MPEAPTGAEGKPNLASIIATLLAFRDLKPVEGRAANIAEEQIEKLCCQVHAIFHEQPMLLELDAPMVIVGDVHGQFFDLLRIFEYCGSPKDINYLFLGDYVDRGKNSLETILLLFAYKAKYAENFFLLRGNHECSSINKLYGFFDECKRRYSVKLWKKFCDVFNYLPVCAVLDDRIICMHGGLSPELHSLEQIRQIPRPIDVPDSGLLCDLLWADPDKECLNWGENDRGVSFTFGPQIVSNFCKKFELDLICRAHQVVEDGYEFFANRQLVTVFSAPNYCREFDNAGAVMTIDDKLRCSFKVLKPILVKGGRMAGF